MSDLKLHKTSGADRAVIHDGDVVLKFIGGDGEIAVSMPVSGAVETAMHLLKAQGESLKGVALATDGLTAGRSPDNGHLVLTIHLSGGAKLHFVVPPDQEEGLYNLPRIPAPPPKRAH